MNENDNLLLRDREVSNKGSTDTALDRNADAPSTVVNNPPEDRVNEASENFASLTYVSSQGFFFQ